MVLGRVLVALGGFGVGLILGGCQPLPLQPAQGVQATEAPAPVVSQTQKGPITQTAQVNHHALDLRIFLASELPMPGWIPVNLSPQGVLYVMTEPVITRRDLTGIQSAVDDKTGEGILIVALSDAGFAKIHAATAAHPGLRLALVVNKTMLAAPGYAAPISKKQLAFHVGSRENADKAARAVAGVEDPAASGL